MLGARVANTRARSNKCPAQPVPRPARGTIPSELTVRSFIMRIENAAHGHRERLPAGVSSAHDAPPDKETPK